MSQRILLGMSLLVVLGLTACGGSRSAPVDAQSANAGDGPAPAASVHPPAPAPVPAPAPAGSADPASSPAAAPASVAVVSPAKPSPPTIQRANVRLFSGVLNGQTAEIDSGSSDYLGTSKIFGSDRTMSVGSLILLPALSSSGGGTPDLFFTVAMGVFDTPIRSLTYQLLRAGDGGQEVGLSQASFDSSSGNFAVPLSSLFGAGWARANSSDRHRLVLNIALQDDRSVEFSVEFSVGGFPRNVTDESTGPGLPAEAGTLEAVMFQGMDFYRDQVTNQAGHVVTVWIKGDPSPDLTMQTQIRHSTWKALVGGPDPTKSGCPAAKEVCSPVPDPTATLSTAHLKVNSFDVIGSHTLTVSDASDWTSVSLAPGESIVVGWKAQVAEGTEKCAVTLLTYQEVKWSEAITGNLGNYYKPHDSQMPVYNWVEGARIMGSWKRDILVAEPFITEDQVDTRDKLSADLKSRITVLEEVPRDLDKISGVAPDPASPPDVCQGSF